jgi:hypothetical protein
MADESAMATDTPRKGDSKRKRVVDDGETPPSAHSVQSSLVSPHDEDNSDARTAEAACWQAQRNTLAWARFGKTKRPCIVVIGGYQHEPLPDSASKVRVRFVEVRNRNIADLPPAALEPWLVADLENRLSQQPADEVDVARRVSKEGEDADVVLRETWHEDRAAKESTPPPPRPLEDRPAGQDDIVWAKVPGDQWWPAKVQVMGDCKSDPPFGEPICGVAARSNPRQPPLAPPADAPPGAAQACASSRSTPTVT